jgi:hypothetical protein
VISTLNNTRLRLVACATLVASTLVVLAWQAQAALAAPGDGTADAVTGDSPTEATAVIKDVAFEYAPTIIGVMAAVFGFTLTLSLIRRGKNKGGRAMVRSI